MQTIPYGYCQCGCGERTRIAPQTHKGKGWVKGEPLRYRRGHREKMGLPTPAQEVEICRRYQDGEVVPSISKSFGINRHYVYPILRRHGIEPDRNGGLAESKQFEIVGRYVAGQNAPFIGRKLGMDHKDVYKILRRHGIETRSPSEAGRIYSCDHSFFDSIDTEEKAYWLGFIAADGNVGKNKKALRVDLSSRDHEHLLKLKTALQSTHPIYERSTTGKGFARKGTLFSSFNITSPQICQGLISHGVVPCKTFVLKWPDFLTPDLLRHYLRGYSDGDGCFYLNNSYVRKDGTRSTRLGWSMVGNEGFCRNAQNYLVDTLGFNRTTLRPSPNARNEGIFQLCYTGNKQVPRLWHLLYDEATVFLPRKREVALPSLP